MTCEYCAKDSPIFELKCYGCRDRLVMVEDCKVLREQVAKQIDKDLGFLPNYKREPNCGCKTVCLRKSRIKCNQNGECTLKSCPRRLRRCNQYGIDTTRNDSESCRQVHI